MTRETLNRATEIENKIAEYELLSLFSSFPYQRFQLRKRLFSIGRSDGSRYVTIQDKELANLITKYCNDKIAALTSELAAL